MVQMHEYRSAKGEKMIDSKPSTIETDPLGSEILCLGRPGTYLAQDDQPADQDFVLAKVINGKVSIHASAKILPYFTHYDLESWGKKLQNAAAARTNEGQAPQFRSHSGLSHDEPQWTPLLAEAKQIANMGRLTSDTPESWRPLLPRASSRPLNRMRQDHHVTTITQFHANNKRNDVNYSDGDWEPLAAPLRMKSFFFYEDHKVEKFLLYKIERLQQMANKRIAKAWIKGICPRKQAKFPYSNKARGEKQNLPPLIPGWWPAHGCPFIEPDHITKSERGVLLLHLLCLRPTPEQLKAWNDDADQRSGKDDNSEPNPTHVLYGWTAFLRELASTEVLNDLPNETDEKAKRRKNNLTEMYNVAEKSELFHSQNVGGDHQYQWLPERRDQKRSKRRHREDSPEMVERVFTAEPTPLFTSASRPSKRMRESERSAATMPTTTTGKAMRTKSMAIKNNSKFVPSNDTVLKFGNANRMEIDLTGALTVADHPLDMDQKSDPVTLADEYTARPACLDSTSPLPLGFGHNWWQPPGPFPIDQVNFAPSHFYPELSTTNSSFSEFDSYPSFRLHTGERPPTHISHQSWGSSLPSPTDSVNHFGQVTHPSSATADSPVYSFSNNPCEGEDRTQPSIPYASNSFGSAQEGIPVPPYPVQVLLPRTNDWE